MFWKNIPLREKMEEDFTFQSYSEMFLKQLNHGEAVGLLFQLVHLVYGKSLEEVHRVAKISWTS